MPYVATGQVDGFWEYDLSPLDSAAGILIAKEAGCTVSQLNGEKYNIYDNNILVTNGNIHKEMISVLKIIQIDLETVFLTTIR